MAPVVAVYRNSFSGARVPVVLPQPRRGPTSRRPRRQHCAHRLSFTSRFAHVRSNAGKLHPPSTPADGIDGVGLHLGGMSAAVYPRGCRPAAPLRRHSSPAALGSRCTATSTGVTHGLAPSGRGVRLASWRCHGGDSNPPAGRPAVPAPRGKTGRRSASAPKPRSVCHDTPATKGRNSAAPPRLDADTAAREVCSATETAPLPSLLPTPLPPTPRTSERPRRRRAPAAAPPRASSLLLLDRKEELELGRELLLGVEPVAEVNPANAAVCVNLHAQSLHVVRPWEMGASTVQAPGPGHKPGELPRLSDDCHLSRTVSAAGEVRQIELNLVPPLVEPHGHGADERLHSRC